MRHSPSAQVITVVRELAGVSNPCLSGEKKHSSFRRVAENLACLGQTEIFLLFSHKKMSDTLKIFKKAISCLI